MNEYQVLMTQRELCNRWQVSEATLERWRSEGMGPIYVNWVVKSGTSEKMYWSMRLVA